MFQAKIGAYWAPVTYTWMPDESDEAYREAWRQVRIAVESSGARFSRRCEVMMDYDDNMRITYMEEIGNDYEHDLRGCSFHFGQCIYRWVSQNGRANQYNDGCEVLRDVVHVALGIPYCRLEDIPKIPEDMHTLFDHLEGEDDDLFDFLCFFTDEYIEGYWINGHNHTEISFWNDLSTFSSDHMTNNALESWNNELFTLLGRQAHPNPYVFSQIMEKAMFVNEECLKLVDQGKYQEIRSTHAKKCLDARTRLKHRYVERLARAQNEAEERAARLCYLKSAGATNAQLKGKKARKGFKKVPDVEKVKPKVGKGRPGYKRMKAPEQMDCQYCSKHYKTRAGCKKHMKMCLQSQEARRCKYCARSFKTKNGLTKHTKECQERQFLDEMEDSDNESTIDFLNENIDNDDIPDSSGHEVDTDDDEDIDEDADEDEKYRRLKEMVERAFLKIGFKKHEAVRQALAHSTFWPVLGFKYEKLKKKCIAHLISVEQGQDYEGGYVQDLYEILDRNRPEINSYSQDMAVSCSNAIHFLMWNFKLENEEDNQNLMNDIEIPNIGPFWPSVGQVSNRRTLKTTKHYLNSKMTTEEKVQIFEWMVEGLENTDLDDLNEKDIVELVIEPINKISEELKNVTNECKHSYMLTLELHCIFWEVIFRVITSLQTKKAVSESIFKKCLTHVAKVLVWTKSFFVERDKADVEETNMSKKLKILMKNLLSHIQDNQKEQDTQEDHGRGRRRKNPTVTYSPGSWI